MYKKDYSLEPYLLSADCHTFITKLRTNNNKLAIVTGRYNNTPREDRKCSSCHLNVVGDEYHLIFECVNEEIVQNRNRFIPLYYRNRPSMETFCELLGSKKEKLLNEFSLFLKKSVNIIDYLDERNYSLT